MEPVDQPNYAEANLPSVGTRFQWQNDFGRLYDILIESAPGQDGWIDYAWQVDKGHENKSSAPWRAIFHWYTNRVITADVSTPVKRDPRFNPKSGDIIRYHEKGSIPAILIVMNVVPGSVIGGHAFVRGREQDLYDVDCAPYEWLDWAPMAEFFLNIEAEGGSVQVLYQTED